MPETETMGAHVLRAAFDAMLNSVTRNPPIGRRSPAVACPLHDRLRRMITKNRFDSPRILRLLFGDKGMNCLYTKASLAEAAPARHAFRACRRRALPSTSLIPFLRRRAEDAIAATSTVRAMSTVPIASGADAKPAPKVTLRTLQRKYAAAVPISVLTAYDFTMASAADAAGVDVILVGDSVGMVVHGEASTAPVTLDDMIRHSVWVSRGAPRPFIVGDLPFGTYAGPGPDKAVASAVRLVQEGRVHAVKLEGGRTQAAKIAAIVAEGIPVMGHVGLLPQTAPAVSGYALTGRTADAALAILLDALAVQQAGAFSIVLEKVPSEVAAVASALLSVPTIGIGAGPACGGQVLVSHDLLGLYPRQPPKFVKEYHPLGHRMREAFGLYCREVSEGSFPDALPGWTPPEQQPLRKPAAAAAAAAAAASHSAAAPAQSSSNNSNVSPSSGAPRYHFRMPPAELRALLDSFENRSAASAVDSIYNAVGRERFDKAYSILKRLVEASDAAVSGSEAPARVPSQSVSSSAAAAVAPMQAQVSVSADLPPPSYRPVDRSSSNRDIAESLPAGARHRSILPAAASQPPLKVAIVGSGAIASLFAALLSRPPRGTGMSAPAFPSAVECDVTMFSLSASRSSQLSTNTSSGSCSGLSVRLHESLGLGAQGSLVPLTGAAGVKVAHFPPWLMASGGNVAPGGGISVSDQHQRQQWLEQHSGRYDLVILANKAYQAVAGAAAARILTRKLFGAHHSGNTSAFDRGYILPLYNGGYTLEYLRQQLSRRGAVEGDDVISPDQLLYGTTSHGALASLTSSGATLVTHTGVGQTLIAPSASSIALCADPSAAEAAAAAIAAVLRARRVPAAALGAGSAPAMRWAKLAVNSVLNPVAALLGLRNGEVKEWYAGGGAESSLLARLASETADVMGADLDAYARSSLPSLAALSHAQLLRLIPGWADFDPAPGAVSGPSSAGAYILGKALSVADATAPNVCSYLADLRAGRPTEVQFINGWIAERAEVQSGDRAGEPLTVHADVTDAILAKEGLLVPARGWLTGGARGSHHEGPPGQLVAAIDEIRAAAGANC